MFSKYNEHKVAGHSDPGRTRHCGPREALALQRLSHLRSLLQIFEIAFIVRHLLRELRSDPEMKNSPKKKKRR